MLKIVDYYPYTKIPFPLKELEKFGFEENQREYVKWEEDEWISEAICVLKEKREILIYLDSEYYKCYCGNNVLNILYDLIKAGLVEIMEEQDGNQ